jgi:peptidoglycan/xylan/chitin deacetylase (PgdA/CDA1 family)
MAKSRPDRLFTVSVVHPLRGLLLRDRAQRVPILMYHGIQNGCGARHPYFETNTSPDLFSAQMHFLNDNGYRTTSLADAFQRTDNAAGDDKRVVITFDDGYLDFYQNAFPILSRLRFNATMFVASSFPGASPRKFADKNFMTWSQIKEVSANGIEIGSHTVSHPELWKLRREELEHELLHSKDTIENAIGTSVRSFSHPYAFPEQNTNYRETLCRLLIQSGYENGVTTIIGCAAPENPRYFLPRLPINAHDDLAFFRAKLEGAYDWVHVAQHVYKKWLKRDSSRARITPEIAALSNSIPEK